MSVCMCMCLDFQLSLKVLNPTLSWYLLYVFVVVERKERLLDLLFLFSFLVFSVWSLTGPFWVAGLSHTQSLSRYSRMLTEHKHTRITSKVLTLKIELYIWHVWVAVSVEEVVELGKKVAHVWCVWCVCGICIERSVGVCGEFASWEVDLRCDVMDEETY